jgi:hypothetical protein
VPEHKVLAQLDAQPDRLSSRTGDQVSAYDRVFGTDKVGEKRLSANASSVTRQNYFPNGGWLLPGGARLLAQRGEAAVHRFQVERLGLLLLVAVIVRILDR